MSVFFFLLIADVLFFLTMLATLLENNLTRKSRSVVLIGLIVALAFLILVRPLGIGADDYYYKQMVQDAAYFTFEDLRKIYERDEVYFFFLHYISMVAGVRALMVLASIVFIIKIVFLVRLVQDKLFAIYAYFCLSFFLQDIIQMRASMAVMFMFGAIYFFNRSSYFSSLVSVLGASFSHYSGLSVVFLLRTFRAHRLFYVAPFFIVILSFFGLSGLSISLVSSYVPDIIYIARHLDDDAGQISSADFNLADILLYSAIAISARRGRVSSVASAGLFSANLSALVVLLFRDIPTFAIRMNQMFLTFFVLNVGNFEDRRLGYKKAVLVIALGFYYVRWRWVDLISFYGV